MDGQMVHEWANLNQTKATYKRSALSLITGYGGSVISSVSQRYQCPLTAITATTTTTTTQSAQPLDINIEYLFPHIPQKAQEIKDGKKKWKK